MPRHQISDGGGADAVDGFRPKMATTSMGFKTSGPKGAPRTLNPDPPLPEASPYSLPAPRPALPLWDAAAAEADAKSDSPVFDDPGLLSQTYGYTNIRGSIIV